ncbi:MAG: hypothetical protein ABSC72_11365 [Methylovirgula sp.]|jgi:hypothetical protein
MAKTWEQMAPEEKLEDLRKDIKTLFAHFNKMQESQEALAYRLNGAVSLLHEVAEAVKKLENR